MDFSALHKVAADGHGSVCARVADLQVFHRTGLKVLSLIIVKSKPNGFIWLPTPTIAIDLFKQSTQMSGDQKKARVWLATRMQPE